MNIKKMVEKFLLLNLPHLPCIFERSNKKIVCPEVIRDFGKYLEDQGITTTQGIEIFQVLTTYFFDGIEGAEEAKESINKPEVKPTSTYKPKLPI